MNVESSRNIALDVFYLTSCVLKKKIPDKQRVANMNYEAVLSLAANNMMSTIIAFALESAGIKTQSTAAAITNGVRRDYFFDKSWKEISARFEEASIWYLPLKGAVLKNYYPKSGMREFSDYDILFDKSKAEKVNDIMKSLGFDMQRENSGHDIVFYKPPVLNFEMHTHLFGLGHEQIMNDYYEKIHDRLIKDIDNRYGYHMSNEDFYIYMIAHEYKHYSSSGTGLRSLLDTYVFESSVEMNRGYVRTELQKLGMADYERLNHSLSQKLFTGEPLNDEENKMFEYILSSGTFGTFDQFIENKIKECDERKIVYVLSRFFVPIRKNSRNYDSFAERYP